jgi:hypothetical protein
VRDWTAGGEIVGERVRYCGEILIHSTFGSWAYQWGHIGQPFREFLQEAEFDYVFTKFLGNDFQVFDGEGSLNNLRREVIEHRREGSINKATARALWDEIEAAQHEAEDSSASFVEALRDIADRFDSGWSSDSGLDELTDDERQDAVRFLQEPWELTTTKPHPQAVGFWRDLWPVFVERLKAELAAAPAQEVA